MRAGVLGSYILLLTLVFTLLATVVQANEYSEANKDVQAADVLNHLEKGDDVNLTNCHIFGELNVSKIKLETDPSLHLSIIKSNIIIKNSIFENKLDFSNVQLNNTISFNETIFYDSANFHSATFNNTTDFSGAKFNDAAKFIGPTKPDKLLLDEINFQIFYKYYNGHGRYDDADVVYYNYRQNDMKKEEWSSFG